MGIRLRKFLGYGLTDVQTDEDGYTITDPRIDREAVRTISQHKVDDYLEWLDDNDEKSDDPSETSMDRCVEDLGEYNLSMYDTYAWNPEYGLKNVFALKPLMCTDWHRSNDAIDYAEENLRNGDSWPRVEVFNYPLYPWEAYMDARTGERVNLQDARVWLRVKDAQISGKALDVAARMAGFQNEIQARACIVPLVPHEVRKLSEYLGVFTDADVWKQLRPVLYVYGA